MNDSERFLSAFSELRFYKKLVLRNLHFTVEGSTEKEVADLLIYGGDFVIAIQLKARNEKDQTSDPEKELKWLTNKCKVAKKQVKESITFIRSGDLPTFENGRNKQVKLSATTEIIPLVVFMNDNIRNNYVDLLDYVALGEEIKWEPEMRFAEQLGVVTRESRTRFTINHELRRGYDKLDYWQKNMASELYDEFGDGSFTSSMIFAKLEYNKDRAIATLHTFSMMGILWTDLDAIDGKTITYQFRVTPAEHPECFEKAA